MPRLQILRFLLAITAVLFSFQAAAIDLVPGDIIASNNRATAEGQSMLHVDPVTGKQTLFPSIQSPIREAFAIDSDEDGNLSSAGGPDMG